MGLSSLQDWIGKVTSIEFEGANSYYASYTQTTMEEAQNDNNGSLVAVVEETVAQDEPMVGPGPAPVRRPKRPLQFEQAYLDSLPSANMYD